MTVVMNMSKFLLMTDNAVEATTGADIAKVDEEDVMDKHIDNNHDDQGEPRPWMS